jgi:hypothetical protein
MDTKAFHLSRYQQFFSLRASPPVLSPLDLNAALHLRDNMISLATVSSNVSQIWI